MYAGLKAMIILMSHSPNGEMQSGRLHGAAFLSRALGIEGLTALHFSPDDITPCSRELSDALHEAVVDGAVRREIDREKFRFVKYRLSNEGKQRLMERVGLSSIPKVPELMYSASQKALLLAANALYCAQLDKYGTRATAIEEAMRRCHQRDPQLREDASRILEQLQLLA